MRPIALALILSPTLAFANPKPPKAHVECMSTNPVKSGVAAKLDAELWCTIHVDSLGGFKPASVTGNLTINLAPTTKGIDSQPQFGKLDDTQDGVVFQLQKPWVVDKDYRKCEPFTINASLDDADHPGMDSTLWHATFKVNASCPKPKAVAGALACHYTAQDGTIFKWPGNGAKVKPRMEQPLSCSINAGKPEAGVPYEVSLGVTGKPAKVGKFETAEDGKMFFEATFEEPDYGACSSFVIAGQVKANGASLWSGKLAIKQDCPD
jgi:hypothetical protein